MKIAYIVLKGMPLGGGIEKYTEEVGSRLAMRGHDITVYVMRHYGAKDGLYRGMRIKTVPCIKSRSCEKITASLMATVNNILTENPDIVHFHASGSGMFQFMPCSLDRKVVVQGHGIEWKRSKWSFAGKTFLRLSEFLSFRFSRNITVVSNVQREYIKKKYGRESVYIPTGVNLPQIESPCLINKYGLKGNDYILFAARLVREKGAHYLIEAFTKLKSELKLVIAGDAQYEEKYKAELHKLAGRDGRIIFTGFVTGKLLGELFSNPYVFVLPSEIEGLPTALLEAMSYGNCCLVSNIPENIEALNGFGYVFVNKDETDLKNKIEYLINNKADVDAVKPKSKEYVLKNYLWEDIALKLEKFYKSVLMGEKR